MAVDVVGVGVGLRMAGRVARSSWAACVVVLFDGLKAARGMAWQFVAIFWSFERLIELSKASVL